MRKLLLISTIIMIGMIFESSAVYAQQDAQYTQYMYNMNILNPAYAGSVPGTLSVTFLGRKQWDGIPGAPNTATLSIDSPITDRMGLGASIYADQIGPVNEQFVYADYSYTIPVGYYDNLAFGLKAGVSMLNAKLTDLKRINIDDINFNQNISNAKPNFGFGLFYYSDIYYVGLSVPNLLKTEYIEKKGQIATSISKRQHMFLTAGYVFDIDYNWRFKPSLMLKAAFGAPLSVDLSANFLYDETYELGASYRWGDSFSMVLGSQVTESLRVGYSYDFTTSALTGFNTGTHELILMFDIVTAYEIISPRFF